jgi:AMMECR1 domain-containing protein
MKSTTINTPASTNPLTHHIHHTPMTQVGVHGIIIAFKCPSGSGRRYSATYLPEVAREQRE